MATHQVFIIGAMQGPAAGMTLPWLFVKSRLNWGLLRQAATLLPIPASQYPTPARRPAYSVLDKTLTRKLLGHSGHHWTSQLRAMLVDLQQHEQQNEKQQP
jgi:hypothetical protein